MAAGATAETVLRRVLAGSLVMQEFEVERRPYHQNCSCALHNLKGICSSGCSRAMNLSFSNKKTWRNDCFLSWRIRNPFVDLISSSALRLRAWSRIRGRQWGVLFMDGENISEF
ncbi:hypothetical protein V6N13_095295 [Hibiscus sabdariffa]|uniref:Uncharacterized protein n=1 Tax=Hibiscus sabdariffa TaxID=183260 RepID=A0ABR2PS35_9ROSI